MIPLPASQERITRLQKQGADMLILTRRVGETVMIGNDITVTVLGVKGNQVRVGVNAPKEVAVHREEIYERIKREEQAAGGALKRPLTGAGSCRSTSRIGEPRKWPSNPPPRPAGPKKKKVRRSRAGSSV